MYNDITITTSINYFTRLVEDGNGEKRLQAIALLEPTIPSEQNFNEDQVNTIADRLSQFRKLIEMLYNLPGSYKNDHYTHCLFISI